MMIPRGASTSPRLGVRGSTLASLQRGGPMPRDSFGRQMAWAAVTALAVAGAPGLAAIDSAAAHDRQDEICTNSTGSIQQLAMIEKPGEDSVQCLSVTFDGDVVK